MQIQLKLENIDHKFVNNISFCLMCRSGCLGSSGYIFFMDSKGLLYSCNYDNEKSKEYINPDLLSIKCNFYGLELNLKRIGVIRGWDRFYLGGCGNYLSVNPKYALNFYRFAYGKSCLELYENWQEYARRILCTN